MSRSLLALNLLFVIIAVFLSVWIVRVVSTTPARPPAPAARPVHHQTPSVQDASPPIRLSLDAYDNVVKQNLFSPSRSGGATQSAPPVTAEKPILHGVVMVAETGFAYLEDPVSKRVSGYKTGDEVAGGQVERIEQDRVVIRRSEGVLEVMLRDPSKPKLPVNSPTPTGVRPASPDRPANPNRPSVAELESTVSNPPGTFRAAPRGHPQWGGR
jgi:type II secretory pathway component PulC